MSRLIYILLGIIIAGASALLLHLSRPAERGVVGISPVDSVRVGKVRDSLKQEAVQARAALDSLQAQMDSASPDTVWRVVRRLVRDTVDTERVDTLRLVARLAVDDSACRVERDSLTGDVMLWKARDAAHAEAFRIAQERPVVVGDTSPPSRTTWAAVGAAGALTGVAALLIVLH